MRKYPASDKDTARHVKSTDQMIGKILLAEGIVFEVTILLSFLGALPVNLFVCFYLEQSKDKLV